MSFTPFEPNRSPTSLGGRLSDEARRRLDVERNPRIVEALYQGHTPATLAESPSVDIEERQIRRVRARAREVVREELGIDLDEAVESGEVSRGSVAQVVRRAFVAHWEGSS